MNAPPSAPPRCCCARHRTLIGYGWKLSLIRGEPVIGHSGSTRGFNSYGLRMPSRGV
jgi:hypothetical protein